ncbi:hypothetical protein NPIL_275541 [Nephila pilipes]|uniref:Uncharacterized protein n=1 Tax=Nephila pilipes TaxID=299642 RepID=A0A8X6UMK1_NEPPI|nr:hypothetical protein NPIL_275541 [Nephila pilipes]
MKAQGIKWVDRDLYDVSIKKKRELAFGFNLVDEESSATPVPMMMRDLKSPAAEIRVLKFIVPLFSMVDSTHLQGSTTRLTKNDDEKKIPLS